MGWSVHVTDVVAHIAQCAETGCEWVGELTCDRESAQREADHHRLHHIEEWRRQNEEWDRQGTAGAVGGGPETRQY